LKGDKPVIYAGILAAGKGTRMGNVDLPKQFLTLGNRPILIHTVEKFLLHDQFDKILIMAPKEWMSYTIDIIRKYIGNEPRLIVVEGGSGRNDSIMNGLRYLDEHFGITDEDVVITHDSVRPFLTRRIIEENIEAVLRFDAVDTAIPAIDTIIESEDGQVISSIPVRDKIFQGQTPQSFNIKKLVRYYNSLSQEQRAILTDACKIFTLVGESVKIVRGEVFNIKITTPYDLKVAEALLEGGIRS
jgi:2-C-methyl-D-erythritol 4-phosphate cytidylyltransferase